MSNLTKVVLGILIFLEFLFLILGNHFSNSSNREDSGNKGLSNLFYILMVVAGVIGALILGAIDCLNI